MRYASLFLVVLMPRLGAADPPSRTRDCVPTGVVLLEVDQSADPRARLVTATTELYDNGAWKTVVIDVDGKVARTRKGCLETAQIDAIRRELNDATWATHRSELSCRSDNPRFTLYKWKSRTVYTERTCNTGALDDSSRHALDIVELYLQVPVDLDGATLSPTCRENPLAPGCN
jgi:hypothetical protein